MEGLMDASTYAGFAG